MYKIDITHIKNKEYLFTLYSAIIPNNEETSSEELTLMLDQLMVEIINFNTKLSQNDVKMQNVKIRGEPILVPKIRKIESNQLSNILHMSPDVIESLSSKKKVRPVVANLKRLSINGVVNKKKHWTEYLPENSFNPRYKLIKHMKFDFDDKKLLAIVLRNMKVVMLHQIQYFNMVNDLKSYIEPTTSINTLDDDDTFERNERLEMKEIMNIKKMTVDEKVNQMKNKRKLEDEANNEKKNKMMKKIICSIIDKINFDKIVKNNYKSVIAENNNNNIIIETKALELDENRCYAYIKGVAYSKLEYDNMINKRKQHIITYDSIDDSIPKEVVNKLNKALKNHEIQHNTRVEYIYKNRTYEYYVNGKPKQFSKRQKWKNKRYKSFKIRNFELQVQEQTTNLRICSRFLREKGVGFSRYPIDFTRITKLSKKILTNAKRVANLITASSTDECVIPLVSWVGVFWHIIYKNVLQKYN